MVSAMRLRAGSFLTNSVDMSLLKDLTYDSDKPQNYQRDSPLSMGHFAGRDD